MFPGPGTGSSRFVLVEDDGLTENGPATRLTLELSWTPEAIRLHLTVAGDFPLSYDMVPVHLAGGGGRPLRLTGGGERVTLRASAPG